MNIPVIKNIYTLLFLICFISNSTKGQPSFYERLKNINLSLILNPDTIVHDASEKLKRPEPLGYIDTNYQRLRVHFLSIEKSNVEPYVYNVSGKTKVKENICSFSGTIKIKAAVYDTTDYQMMNNEFPQYRQGLIFSTVSLEENKSQQGAGMFNGELKTDIYFDEKGIIHYNALMLMADGFSNNQFKGTWTSYKTNKAKVCSWGDFRIPESGDLDVGDGEFIVNEKYVKNGWESYRFAWCCAPDEEKEETAMQKELEEWWK